MPGELVKIDQLDSHIDASHAENRSIADSKEPENQNYLEILLPQDPRRIENDTVKAKELLKKALEPLSPEERVDILVEFLAKDLIPKKRKWEFIEFLDFCEINKDNDSLVMRAIQQEDILAMLGSNAYEGAQNFLAAYPQNFLLDLINTLRVEFQESELTDCKIDSDHKTLVLSEQLINPLTFLLTEKFYSRPYELFWDPHDHSASYSQHHLDYYLALGYLYGKFDKANPDIEEVERAVLRNWPSATELKMVANFEAEIEQYETEGLKKLKAYWHDIFVAYWTNASYSQGYDTANPISRHSSAKYPNPVDTYQSDPERGEAVLEANVFQARTQLNHKAVEIVRAYFPESQITSRELLLVFNHARAELLFPIIAAKLREIENEDSETTISNVVELLVATFGEEMTSNQLLTLFGPEFLDLADEEKLGLICYLTFLGNGTVINNSRNVVGVIQDVLKPRLDAYYPDDNRNKKELQLEIDDSEENWLRQKQAAQKRLTTSKDEDGVLWCNDEQLIAVATATKTAFAESLGKTQKQFESLFEYKYLPRISAAQIVMVAEIITIALNGMLLAEGNRSPLALCAGLIGTFASPSAFKTLYYHFSYHKEIRDLAKRIDPFNLPSEEELEQIVKEIEQAPIDNLKKDQLSKILIWGIRIAYIAGISAMLILPRAAQLISNIDLDIGNGQAQAYEAGKENNQNGQGESQAVKQAEYSEYSPANENSPPQLGEPRFETWGVREPLFWNQALCQAENTYETSMQCTSDDLTLYDFTSHISWEKEEEYIEEKVQYFADNPDIIVRKNLDSKDHRYSIPGGYYLMYVLTTAKYPTDNRQIAEYASAYGIQLTDVFDDEQTYFFYSKLKPGDENIFDDTSKMDHFYPKTDSIRWSELPHVEQIVKMARQQKMSGLSTKQILENIKLEIGNLGVEYGHQQFPNFSDESQGNTPIPENPNLGNQFEELFRKNPDGSLKYSRWDCDQFSFATYIISNAAGIPTSMALGSAQDPSLVLAGNPGYNHAVVVYQDKNENGTFDRMFDATLPSSNMVEIPENQMQHPEKLLVEKLSDFLTENQTSVALGLLIALALGIAGTKITRNQLEKHNKKRAAHEKAYQQSIINNITTSFNQLSDSAKLQVMYLLLSASGLTLQARSYQESSLQPDNRWFSYHYGQVEHTEENAEKIMIDFAKSITGNKRSQHTERALEIVTRITQKFEVFPDFSSRRTSFVKAVMRHMLPGEAFSAKEQIGQSLTQLLDKSELAYQAIETDDGFEQREDYDNAVSFLRLYASLCL